MRQYTRVLRVRGIGRTFTLGLCGKLAVIAIPIVLTLHVSLGLGRGLGQAGLVTGVWLLGLMVGSPAQGWAIDRRGMRSVLLLSAAAQAVFWSVASLLSYQELLVAAAASGLLLVPASTPVRLALTALVSVEDRQTAFAIDSLITELSYMTGPLIGVLLSTQVSTAVATRGLGGLLVLSMVLTAIYAPIGQQGEQGHGVALDRYGKPLVVALACGFISGTVTSGFEISVVGTLESQHATGWLGLLISACGVYAALGALLFGALRTTYPAWLPTLLFGLVTVPLGLVPGWRWLFLAVAPVAMLSSIAFAAAANAVSRAAPAAKRGRAMSTYGAALAGGNALGAPLAGLANQGSGMVLGFAVVGCLAVVVAVAAFLTYQVWPVRQQHESAAVLVKD